MTRITLSLVAGLLATGALAQYYGADKSIQPIGSGRRALQASNSEIGVDQKLNDALPLDLKFTDSNGKPVVLRDLFQGRPVILMPVFYECGGVCALEMNSMVETVKEFKNDSVGEQFDIVTFTIKPTETIEQAATKKMEILDVYNRASGEDGWHFLIGEYDQIRALTDAIGFRYTYDPETGAVLHPAAAVVVTANGHISQYFLETSYVPSLMSEAINVARKGNVGRKVESDSFWNCIEVDPLTGQRSLNILKFVKLSGLAMLIAVAGSIIYMTRKYKSDTPAEGGQPGS